MSVHFDLILCNARTAGTAPMIVIFSWTSGLWPRRPACGRNRGAWAGHD